MKRSELHTHVLLFADDSRSGADRNFFCRECTNDVAFNSCALVLNLFSSNCFSDHKISKVLQVHSWYKSGFAYRRRMSARPNLCMT